MAVLPLDTLLACADSSPLDKVKAARIGEDRCYFFGGPLYFLLQLFFVNLKIQNYRFESPINVKLAIDIQNKTFTDNAII